MSISIETKMFEQLKIDGTFGEFVESIREKVNILINRNRKDKLTVVIQTEYWGKDKQLPVKKFFVDDGIYFVIAELEFIKNKQRENSKVALQTLVHTRYIDMLWSVNSKIQELYNFLKGANPNYNLSGKYIDL